MQFMCPYCSVEYTAEAPCFCHPAAPALAARPVIQAETIACSEPKLAPEDLAVILSLRIPARGGRVARA